MNTFNGIKCLVTRHTTMSFIYFGSKNISNSSIYNKTSHNSMPIKGQPPNLSEDDINEADDPNVSPRVREFREKLRATTDIKDLGVQTFVNPAQEKEPLQAWPDGRNPHTGEVGGPKGPEPTRYGDWERKGKVSDF